MYQSRNVWRYCGAFAAVVVCVMWIGGCSDLPTNHVSKLPTMDYVIYFHSMVGNRQIYKYHPKTQHLDSATLQYQITGYDFFKGVSLSANGYLLYMPFEHSIVVFDSDSLAVVAELPYDISAPVAVSPDGMYIAFSSGGLYVLNSDDYSGLHP